MRVVITGGAGFIGSNLVHHWLDSHPEDEVTVVDALTYAGRRESLADVLGKPRLRFLQQDITDVERTAQAVHGAELVVHLAAESHNDRAIREPLPFARTNALGTAVLLEACRKADVRRFHHVSTDEVYGSLSLDDPARFTEESPYRPRGPYSASKASSDHFVRAWSETYGLEATISNCGNNFGPYQFPEKFVPLAITRLLRGRRVPLYGDGRHVRDWIFVADHCDALDRIAHAGRPGQTYLVSAENELSNRELLEQILRRMQASEESIEPVADRAGHDRRYSLDPTKLKAELGWRPRHEFGAALDGTIEWYRTHESWWGPLAVP
jgi:dTDP-glucose 4,6-dehydratase